MILLDLDGVLADFRSAALYAHNVRSDKGWEDSWYPDWAPTREEFWPPIAALGGDFYGRHVKPYSWADGLFAEAKSADPDVRIVTCSAQHHEGYEGKRVWVNRYLGLDVDVMIVTDKWLLADPDRLLIDDSEHQIDSFARHGGKTLLFPQHWNRNRRLATERRRYVQSVLKTWKVRHEPRLPAYGI